jgi:Lipase (class 3)
MVRNRSQAWHLDRSSLAHEKSTGTSGAAVFSHERRAEKYEGGVGRLHFPRLLTGRSPIQYGAAHDAWAYIAQADDIVVLSFRGTQSIKNWHTNFQVRLVHPDGTDPKLLVHEGFYKAFIALDDPAVYFQKRSRTFSLQKKMEEIKQTTKGAIPIYITGHSLGGALAQIATAVFGSDQIAACYTFGSPRVGNSYFDLWVKPPSYRVMNYADIVPTVPFPLAAAARARRPASNMMSLMLCASAPRIIRSARC